MNTRKIDEKLIFTDKDRLNNALFNMETDLEWR
jgi:hypothetical protein